MTCPDPFIIIGTDDENVTTTEILSRTNGGNITEDNKYSHILVIQPDPNKKSIFTMAESATAEPPLSTMTNGTFLLRLPESITVFLFCCSFSYLSNFV